MAKVAKKGNLFLVEFIVKKINFLRKALKKPEYKIGKLTVHVKFLNLPAIEIEEETKGKLVGKGEFKKGRSCLFSLPNAPPPYLLDTEFYIIRKRPDGVVPDRVTLGRTKINFSCHFINIMKMATLRPQELPVCKALLDTYEITNIKDPSRPIGTITLIMRATCLGKLVVTQLHKQSENSILVKGSKDPTLFECESVIRNISTAPVLRSTPKTPCGDEKDLSEEFKSLIVGKKVVCDDRAAFMKPDPCVKCSGISFRSFYDDCNRVCLVYGADGSCGKSQDENVLATESPLASDGAVAAAAVASHSPSCPPPSCRWRPVLRQHAGNQTEPLSAGNSRASMLEEPLKVDYPSARALGKRSCKVCSRPKQQEWAWCAAFAAEAGGGERAGAGAGAGACEEPPCAPPAAAREPREGKKPERVPRTAAIGRAVILERLRNAQRAATPGRRVPHCPRQPLRHLSAARRWETGELLDPNPEPPEWSARFPPSLPYDDHADIHIRTPSEPQKHVFVMKIQPKARRKPRLQLELRTPRRPQPGDPPPEPAPAPTT